MVSPKFKKLNTFIEDELLRFTFLQSSKKNEQLDQVFLICIDGRMAEKNLLGVAKQSGQMDNF